MLQQGFALLVETTSLAILVFYVVFFNMLFQHEICTVSVLHLANLETEVSPLLRRFCKRFRNET